MAVFHSDQPAVAPEYPGFERPERAVYRIGDVGYDEVVVSFHHRIVRALEELAGSASLGHLLEGDDGDFAVGFADEVADFGERFELEGKTVPRIEFAFHGRLRAVIGHGGRKDDGVGRFRAGGGEDFFRVFREGLGFPEDETAVRDRVRESEETLFRTGFRFIVPRVCKRVSEERERGRIVAHVADGMSAFEGVFGDFRAGSATGNVGKDPYVVDGYSGSAGGDGEVHMRNWSVIRKHDIFERIFFESNELKRIGINIRF